MTAETIAFAPAKPAPASSLYAAAFAALKIRMPLRHDTSCCGTIVDADGNMVCVVDMHGERPDAEVADIAELLLLAINVHAGFLPEARHAG
ncbi:hypothetical protein ATY76_13335 [Rhizobium sp. R339]|uniref:hypothetical protein n=1 Tax=Rhizobium sp. R339 TaxID=1764273 RepID=UPI000B52A324|nr:hypothetical protein [Rhizobium sp. R339]OWV67907.1 hypothetical protein ATY76_13335 [Rhizobium sp. R339]